MAEPPPAQYAVGEMVLVSYTDKFYEAKVQKTEYKEDQWHYLLHYSGWNKKFDEWVEESGMKKAPAAPTPAAKAKKAKDGKAAKAKKQTNAAEAGPVQFAVHIPAVLKVRMLEDYDMIKKESKMVPLPRKPNVHEILALYVRDAFDRNGSADVEDDLAAGLKLYFDKALIFSLLYPEEREQAQRALANGKMPCAVYGVEHLMRLFWKLPELLPTADMPQDQIVTLQTRLDGILSFIRANEKKFFISEKDYKHNRFAATARKQAAEAARQAAAAAAEAVAAGTSGVAVMGMA